MGLFSSLGSMFAGSGGGLFSAASSLIGGVLGASNEQKIASQNFALQREQYEYQKQVQQETWKREDNATQRKVADLKASGLSPVLAAGSASPTSSPIKIEAPQLERTQSKSAAAFNSLSNALSVYTQAKQAQLLDAQIHKTSADERNVEAQALRNIIGADLDRANLSLFPLKGEALRIQNALANGQISQREAQTALTRLQNAVVSRDLKLSAASNMRYKDVPSVNTAIFGAGREFNDWLSGLGGGQKSLSPTPQTFDWGLRNLYGLP